MKSPAIVINLLAILYIVLGVVWFESIQLRWKEISPDPVFSKAVSVAAAVPAEPLPKKVRSPHAKWYHDLVFWTICKTEVFVAVFYLFAGIFLFKRYVLALWVTAVTLWADLLLKVTVIVFMQFGTIPLSRLIHNPNLLQLYFMPSVKLHNRISAVVSGYQFFMPLGILYAVIEIGYFILCFYLLSQPEIKDQFKKIKKI